MAAIAAGNGYRAALVACTRGRWPRREVLLLHLQRSTVATFMALTFFYALTKLPIAEAIAISFVAPLIALYLARIMLGETIRQRGNPRLDPRLCGDAGDHRGQDRPDRFRPRHRAGTGRDPEFRDALCLQLHPDPPAIAGRRPGRDRHVPLGGIGADPGPRDTVPVRNARRPPSCAISLPQRC